MSSILAMTTLSIAQLVEQRTVVPLVTGSSPVAEKVRVPERSKGLVLGTNVFALAGSNPVLHRIESHAIYFFIV